jgi:hypothetical protein
MGAGEIVGNKDVRENEVVEMTPVARDKDQGGSGGRPLDTAQTLHVQGNPFKHGFPYPAEDDGKGINKRRAVIGRDIVQIRIGLFIQINEIFLAGLGIFLDETLKTLSPEDTFFELRPCLKDRPCDALTMAIHLIQEAASQNVREFVGTPAIVAGFPEKLLEVQCLRDLHKGLLRRADQGYQSTEPSRVFLASEKDVHKTEGGFFGLLTEEEPQGHNINGPVHFPLKLDEVCQGVPLGLYKSEVKPSAVHERQEGGSACFQFALEITRFVRVGEGPEAYQVIKVSEGNAKKPGEFLPPEDPVLKTYLRKGHALLLISDVVEDILKDTLVFGSINDNPAIFKSLQKSGLGGVGRGLGE